MADPEKPLHVQVALALGCKPEWRFGEWDCTCDPKATEHPHAGHSMHPCHDGEGLGCEPWWIARYDTDPAAWGPLIEEYGLSVLRSAAGPWWARRNGLLGEQDSLEGITGKGETPGIAICNLILLLAKEGRLEKTP